MIINPHASCFTRSAIIIVFLAVITGYMPKVWAQSLDYTPPTPEGPAKIESSLWDLAATGQAAAKPASPGDSQDIQEPVVVILVPYPGEGSASIDSSAFAGLGIEVLARSKSLMRVSVPAPSLLAVSEQPGISFVRKPYRPHVQVGKVLTEGARSVRSIANQLGGVKGKGVKVAIIDGGFKGADLLGMDLPDFWWIDFTGEGMYSGDIVHGTACAEIVHDLAPEAELYLLKVGDFVDLEKAKDRSIKDDIEIISYSAGGFYTGFGDGRGLVSATW